MKNPYEHDEPVQLLDEGIQGCHRKHQEEPGDHDFPGIEFAQKPATERAGQESRKSEKTHQETDPSRAPSQVFKKEREKCQYGDGRIGYQNQEMDGQYARR